jgi:spore coat protein U-like protein
MKKFIIAALGVALGVVGVNAYAGTSPQEEQIQPTLTLTASCSIDVASFPAVFTPSTTGVGATVGFAAANSVKVICPGALYKLGADVGSAAGTGDIRKLHDSVTTTSPDIVYTLTANATPAGGSSTLAWGNAGMTANGIGANTMQPIDFATAGGGSVAGETYTVTGAATVLATSPVGTYQDTVTITLEW